MWGKSTTTPSSSSTTTPSLSTILQSTSGIYRDPTRISSDATALLSSPIGRNLRPSTSPLTQNDGTVHTKLLVFQGTIPMTFKGNTYNIPFDVFLPPSYPLRPPLCFVRPVSNMVIKDNHRHVGSDGMVYMPYLSRWSPSGGSNLVEMCVVMSSLFGADPPVFSRRNAAPAPAPGGTTNVAGQVASQFASAWGGWGGGSAAAAAPAPAPAPKEDYDANERRRREAEERRKKEEDELAKAIAQSRMEERSRMEEERLQREEERRRMEEIHRLEEEERMTKDRKEREERILVQTMRDDLTRKLRGHLREFYDDAKDTISSDLKDQNKLEKSQTVLQTQLEEMKTYKAMLERSHEQTVAGTEQISVVLDTVQIEDDKPPPIDDQAVPRDVYSKQMMDLAVRNAAMEDCLYFLDKALSKGTIPLDVHLKKVRMLARKQFLVKVHLLKVVRAVEGQNAMLR